MAVSSSPVRTTAFDAVNLGSNPSAAANTNTPKVLVEFSDEEIKWLADLLHVEWGRNMQREQLVSTVENQKMQNRLRNRILNKASEQGFGEL